MSATPSSDPTAGLAAHRPPYWTPLAVWFGYLLALYGGGACLGDAIYDLNGDLPGEPLWPALTVLAVASLLPLLLVTGLLVRDRYRSRALRHPKSRAAGAVAVGTALSFTAVAFAVAGPYTRVAALFLAAVAGTAALAGAIWALSGNSRRLVGGVLAAAALCAAGGYGTAQAVDGETGWRVREYLLVEAESQVEAARSFEGTLYWFPGDYPYSYPVGDGDQMAGSSQDFPGGMATVFTYAKDNEVAVCTPGTDVVCVDLGDGAVLVDQGEENYYQVVIPARRLHIDLYPNAEAQGRVIELAREAMDALEPLDPNAHSGQDLVDALIRERK